jgi:hypothetical protein
MCLPARWESGSLSRIDFFNALQIFTPHLEHAGRCNARILLLSLVLAETTPPCDTRRTPSLAERQPALSNAAPQANPRRGYREVRANHPDIRNNSFVEAVRLKFSEAPDKALSAFCPHSDATLRN